MRKLIFFICVVLSIQSFSQEKRFALVIGNSAYEHGGALKNPVNDAYSMNQALSKVGFEVVEYYNLDYRQMKRAIDEFGIKLKDYDVGLFFYAGHGIQTNGQNYLIPVDANLQSENDVEYDCIDAGRVLGKMEDAANRTNIIILDACRNNPFERSWTRNTKGRGLASMDAPIGSILAYATAPGTTASDGSGQNGLYTSALIENLIKAEISIEKVFKLVRIKVVSLSNGSQIPWESTSLMGDFYFNDIESNNEDQSVNLYTEQIRTEDPVLYETKVLKGIITDSRDSQSYEWVRVGNQIWMAKNMNYETPEGSWCYENDSMNCNIYGRLYFWEHAQNVCPDGWHLPSDEEWKALELSVGMTQNEADKFGVRGVNEGGKLKGTDDTLWNSPNEGAIDEIEFGALPGGVLNNDGTFMGIGDLAFIWTASEYDKETIYSRALYSNDKEIFRISYNSENTGLSVRCVKDQP